MKEKLETAKEQARLLWTCVKYDVKSAILAAKIQVMRLRVKMAKKAVEMLRDEL